MQTGEVGFMSSWRMLTRDKGWVKPLLVLTLVSWILILGQIAVLGYGLEWARLTAWGVESAPKQRGVDYGKVISTGARAFLITMSQAFVCGLVLQILFPGSLAALMAAPKQRGVDYGKVISTGARAFLITMSQAFVCGLVLQILFPGSLAALMAMTTGGSGLANSVILASGATFFLLDLVIIVFAGTFLQAAALRGTLYDSFSAGWRLDRLFQMVVRDFGGFCKVLLVTHGRQRSRELGHPGFRGDVLPARPRYHGVRRYVFAGGGAARNVVRQLFCRMASRPTVPDGRP